MPSALIRSFTKVSPSRSYNMARVRGDTATHQEKQLASVLWRLGFRGYRRRCQKHLGKPDFCFHYQKVAVFVDGCFWHCCPIHFKLPSTNVTFWKKKLGDNQLRDRRQARLLKASGWKVIRVWSHELKTKIGINRTVKKIGFALQRYT